MVVVDTLIAGTLIVPNGSCTGWGPRTDDFLV
jgi:hypothetical protein